MKVLQAIAVIVGLAILPVLPVKAFSAEVYDPKIVIRKFSVRQKSQTANDTVFAPTKLCELEPAQKESKEVAEYRLLSTQKLLNAWDSKLQFPGKAQPVVKITVSAQGQLLQSELLHSSLNADLDQKLLASLNSAFPLPAAPNNDKASNQDVIYILTPKMVEFYKLHASAWNFDFIETVAKDYNPIARKWVEEAISKITHKIAYPYPVNQELDIHVYVVADSETGEVLVHKIVKTSCFPAYDDAVEKAFEKLPFLPKPEKPSPLGIIRVIFSFTRKPKTAQ